MIRVFAVLTIALSLLTPAYAEVITDFDGTNAGCVPTNPATLSCRIPVTVIAPFPEITIGDEQINDPELVKPEQRRLQDAAFLAINKQPGIFRAISRETQIAWFKECTRLMKLDRNLDCTTVKVFGQDVAPRYSIEIIEVSWGTAHNDYDLTNVVSQCNGNWSYVLESADLQEDFTVMRLKAVVRDIRTRQEVFNCKGNMIVAQGKGDGSNISFYSGIFSVSKEKDTNLTRARQEAVCSLMADLAKQLHGIKL